MSQTKVLVTGMSGLIGGALRVQLDGKCELTALNRRDVPGVRCHRADVADFDAIRPAFEGQDVVVHLAAIAQMDASWEQVLSANITGTYNVFEAARQAGVKRIVYASSGATISGWEREFPYDALVEGRYGEVPEAWEKITHEWPARPTGLYGCSKVWGETLARHFTDTSELSIICLRIGAVNQEDRPTRTRHFSVWCSQSDVSRMIETCIEAPDSVRYDIFFVVSDNKWAYRDMAHAREAIGFEPQDEAEDYR